MSYDKLIFELGSEGMRGYRLPGEDDSMSGFIDALPEKYRRSEEVDLPQVSETEVYRHYMALSKLNYSVDDGFYPLGSCTMKYNPKINEDIAAMEKFRCIHPLQPDDDIQGTLSILHELEGMLCEISGMDYACLQPAAGAHGEFLGLLFIKKYHEDRGDFKRTKIIVPDSSHGTNPSSAAVAGLEVVEIKSDDLGNVDISSLKEALNDEVAGLMLTNPSTLGLFEVNIEEIAKLVHDAGGLLYYDGANMNAILSKCRPGDMGFDVMHYNVHKTFSTPHGGGGPGAGPVCIKAFLKDYMPSPVIVKEDDRFRLEHDIPKSLGKIKGFWGNFGVLLRAYTYIKTMGADGLKEVSELAVLNANYLMRELKEHYHLPIDRVCMHEFVLSGFENMHEAGVSTLDLAKRMIDFNIHPPTIYFPLIIKEALMIEPTETESLETLDKFVEIMKKIKAEALEHPEILKSAPVNAPIRRVDEVKAAKDLQLCYCR